MSFDNENSSLKPQIGIFPMVGDLLHVGHLYALRQAKELCDELIVALNVDPTIDNPNKNKPIETVYERWYRILATNTAVEIIPYCGEKDLELLLSTIPHTIRFIGDDHKNDWTGKKYEETHNIKTIVLERSHNESSTNLRNRIIGNK